LVARLYAAQYADEVAGIVFVEHALMLPLTSPKVPPPLPPSNSQLQGIESDPNFSKGIVFADHALTMSLPSDAKVLPPPLPSDAKVLPPPPPSKSQALGGIESDPNFSKLSSRDRQLYHWAMSQTRNQVALQANLDVMPQCLKEVDAVTKEQSHPLGDKPLVDVSADMGDQFPDYAKFQTELLSLSQNSKQIVADNSSHFIIIDRPDVVVDAISQVVRSVQNKAKL
jgi:pimeloyl-ACP methyl ester carboxylesterase